MVVRTKKSWSRICYMWEANTTTKKSWSRICYMWEANMWKTGITFCKIAQYQEIAAKLVRPDKSRLWLLALANPVGVSSTKSGEVASHTYNNHHQEPRSSVKKQKRCFCAMAFSPATNNNIIYVRSEQMRNRDNFLYIDAIWKNCSATHQTCVSHEWSLSRIKEIGCGGWNT